MSPECLQERIHAEILSPSIQSQDTYIIYFSYNVGNGQPIFGLCEILGPLSYYHTILNCFYLEILETKLRQTLTC